MVAIDQFLGVMPLKGFYSFPDFFFSLLTDIHLINGTFALPCIYTDQV
jgi:hypothetical protein